MLSRWARLAAALVFVLGVGCSFIPAYTAPAEFRAASFFPADTWFFSDVTLRPSLTQLAGASRLADAFTSQPGWDAYIQRLNGSVGAGGTNVLTDVLNMLDGEVAAGTFGSVTNSAATPQFVMLAHSSNADRLIGVLAASEGIRPPPPRADAHGANIYALPSAGALATLQGWLVLASSQSVLDDTLNRISGTTRSGALSDEPRFKTLTGRLPADRLALEYVDSGAAYRALGAQLPHDQPGLPPETQALLGNIDSQVAASFAAGASGLELRVEGATRLPPERAAQVQANAGLGDPGDAFAHLPPDTLAAFGTGLPVLGPEIDAALNSVLQQAAGQFALPDLAEIELHPSEWLAGPVAIGGSGGTLGEPRGQPNLFAVAQVSDATAAQTDLDSVTSLFPPKSVAQISIAGGSFIQAPVDEAQSVTYGLADDWLYAVSGDAEAVVDAAGSGGLTQNPRFAALQSALGQDRINMFVDIRGARELTLKLLAPQERQMYETEVRPLVDPLAFFGGGMRSDPNGDFHGHFVLGISGS